MYTIFNKKSELFSAISTNANENFKKFYDMYISDVELYNGTGKMFPKTPIPENVVNISMIPWTSFTGFNLNINNNPNYLLPIITTGGFTNRNSSIYLPLSLQIHHSVCDGFHAGLFMNKVQELADNPEEWLQ